MSIMPCNCWCCRARRGETSIHPAREILAAPMALKTMEPPMNTDKLMELERKWRAEAGVLTKYVEDIPPASRRWAVCDAILGIANITRKLADELAAALTTGGRNG